MVAQGREEAAPQGAQRPLNGGEISLHLLLRGRYPGANQVPAAQRPGQPAPVQNRRRQLSRASRIGPPMAVGEEQEPGTCRPGLVLYGPDLGHRLLQGFVPPLGQAPPPVHIVPVGPIGPLLRRGQILQPHSSRPAQGQGPLCSRQSAAAQGQSPGDSQIPCHLSPSPGHRGLPGLLDRRIHIGLGNALLNHNISIRPRRLSIDRPDPFSRRIHRRDHRLVEIFLNGQGRLIKLCLYLPRRKPVLSIGLIGHTLMYGQILRQYCNCHTLLLFQKTSPISS